MSRIGKLAIKIPDKVKVTAQPGLVNVERIARSLSASAPTRWTGRGAPRDSRRSSG